MIYCRCSCVGAGYLSQFHYGSWARMDRVSMVGSCNRDINAARATGLPAYNDLHRMIEETQPDVLDIILPPVVHAQSILSALNAGVKTLVCQKPFCRTLEEAQQITQEAENAGATIIVHENFRFQPWYRAIKKALERGDVGELHQVTFRLRTGDGQGPDAYMERQPYFQQMDRLLVHETAVHLIDVFRYLFGDIKSIYADLRRLNPVIRGEDAGIIIFDFLNGSRGIFDGNRLSDHKAKNRRLTMGEMRIEGAKGTLFLNGDAEISLRKHDSNEEEKILYSWDDCDFGGDCVFNLQRHVVDHLLYDKEVMNTASDYLLNVQAAEAAYQSNDQGRCLNLIDR